MKITVGLTRSHRTGDRYDYVPSMDGYRAGAPQDEIHVALPDDLATLNPTELAEAAFVATNAPYRQDMADHPGAQQVYDALFHGSHPPTRALSIGDTVTVNGRQLACIDVGWLDATDGRNVLAYGEEA